MSDAEISSRLLDSDDDVGDLPMDSVANMSVDTYLQFLEDQVERLKIQYGLSDSESEEETIQVCRE